jgi:hypothetical protein
MTQLTITSEAIKKLDSLSLISDKLEKTSDGTLISFESGFMTIHVFGNSSILEYKVAIENFSRDSALQSKATYITVDLNKFKQALGKCNIGEGGASLNIDHSQNRVYVSSLVDKTKISLSCFDTLDDKQAMEIINDWDARMAADEFTINTVDLEITPEIMDFAETAIKFMSISNETNSIALKDNKLEYADRLSVIEKSCSTVFTKNGETLNLHKFVIDFLKPIIHELKSMVTITYSGSRSFIRVKNDDESIRAVISVPEVSFSFPSEDEFNSIIPEESDQASVSIKKQDMETAVEKFDGIFNPSEYRWKPINFTFDSSKDDVMNMAYSDYSAEVNTSIHVNNVVNLSKGSVFSFQLPALVFDGILDVTQEDEFTMSFNTIAADQQHGLGILFKTDTVKAVCVKLVMN